MKLLLDTHVFIWSFSDVKRLKKNVEFELRDPQNDVYVSVASIGEMQIKLMLKKMKFEEPL